VIDDFNYWLDTYEKNLLYFRSRFSNVAARELAALIEIIKPNIDN